MLLIILIILVSGCTSGNRPVCGNDICEPRETPNNCPADCTLVSESPFALFGPGGKVDEINTLDTSGIRVFLPLLQSYQEIIKQGIRLYNENDIQIFPTILPRNEIWSNDAVKELRNVGIIEGEPFDGVFGYPSDIEAYKNDLRDLVEGMDGDGINDIEGLAYPVNTIQVGNEVGWEYLGDLNDSQANEIEYYYNYLRSIDLNHEYALMITTSTFVDKYSEKVWKSHKEFLKISYETIKENNPDINVVLGAGILQRMEYDDPQDSIKNYFDIIDIHHYGNHTYLEERLDTIFNPIITNYSINKPIWYYEMSGPMKDELFNAEGLKEHSEQVIKLYVSGIGMGVKKMFWASLTPTIGYVDLGFYNLALLDENDAPKPAYHTYELMTGKLNGFKEIVKLDEGLYMFSFPDKDPVFVAWSDSGDKRIDLSSRVTAQNMKVFHIVTELDSSNNPVYPSEETVPSDSILIGETPVFLNII